MRQFEKNPAKPEELMDSEVPPAVSCAICSLPECPGCSSASPAANDTSILAWEGASGSWASRLWSTAIATSLEPQRTFGRLPEGSIGAALGFALVAETLAVCSLSCAILLAVRVIAPGWFAAVVINAAGIGFVVCLALLLSGIMVGLHAVWGVCLELGAHSLGRKADFQQGIRFGLYACGWDLLTSPAGLIQGVLSRGPLAAWGPIAAAMRVPRTAMRAYAEQCRKLDPAAIRRGLQLSIVVIGGLVILAGTALLLVPIFLYATYFGY